MFDFIHISSHLLFNFLCVGGISMVFSEESTREILVSLPVKSLLRFKLCAKIGAVLSVTLASL